MLDIYNLGSGSSGNATVVSDGKTTFLIDVGFNLKTLEQRLLETPYRLKDISFVLFSHLHIDHAQPTGYKAFSPNQLYGCFKKLDIPEQNYLLPFQEKMIHGIKVIPLLASHDDFNVDNTLGFRIENELGESLVYMSDTGYVPEENIPYMSNADYYMFEANHDRTRLYNNPHYPQRLIDRIDSDTGHLNNYDSAINAYYMVGPKTKKFVLIHLSKENNTPSIALNEYKKVFRRSPTHLNIKIEIASPVTVLHL